MTVDGTVQRDPSVKVGNVKSCIPAERCFTAVICSDAEQAGGAALRFPRSAGRHGDRPPASGSPAAGLFPAGRLDKDTVGLVIITDDEDFAHRMLVTEKRRS